MSEKDSDPSRKQTDGDQRQDQADAHEASCSQSRKNPFIPCNERSSSAPQNDQDVSFSRKLAQLLRHGVNPSISIRSDGYASCSDILNDQKFQQAVGNKTIQDIHRVVYGSNKKRFELKQVNNEWMIRAIYGHSIKVGSFGGKRAFTARQPQYDPDVSFSKELVKLLRHGVYPSISIRSDGYASCDDVLSNKEFQEAVGNKTMQDILQLVDGENKKRFELTQVNHEWMIRATYGHSIKVDLTAEQQSDDELFAKDLRQLIASVGDLTLVTEDAFKHRFVHHRTSRDAYSLVQESGLLKTNNRFIQFFHGIPNENDFERESRSHIDVAILLDVKEAKRAGLQFYDSGADLWCPGINGAIPSTMFSHVIQLRPKWKKIA